LLGVGLLIQRGSYAFIPTVVGERVVDFVGHRLEVLCSLDAIVVLAILAFPFVDAYGLVLFILAQNAEWVSQAIHVLHNV